MVHLHGHFNATAPQTEQSEVEVGMVALKLNRGTCGGSSGRGTQSIAIMVRKSWDAPTLVLCNITI